MDVGFGGLCSTQDTPTALLSQAFAPRLGGAACRVVGFPFWAPGPRGGAGTVLLRVSLGREQGRGHPTEPAPLCGHHVGQTLLPMFWPTPEVRTMLPPLAGRPGVG